eukprot:4936774-Pyramimonas_sp.AAC.1
MRFHTPWDRLEAGPHRPPRWPSGQPVRATLVYFGTVLGPSWGSRGPLLWFCSLRGSPGSGRGA